MKLQLTRDLVSNLSLAVEPHAGEPMEKWESLTRKRHQELLAEGKQPPSNYLVYDTHRDAPVGFALRVGKKASIFLVEKMVAGKKLKIHVGLASGRKGAEKQMPLGTAREEAFKLVEVARKHGTNPKKIADKVEAAELTFGQVWDAYIKHLLEREDDPIKPNSELSVRKARDKFKDWEDRKVRLITAAEVIERFDYHAKTLAHKTAAEAMGRWATAAVNHAIDIEVHDAHAEGRVPALTYNPFTILHAKKKYRSAKQLERDYAKKGIRNPLSFSESVGPFVQAAWEYRRENPVAGDFLILDLLWGLRGDECRTFKWRDRITDAEAVTDRWIDMDKKVARVNDAKNRGDHEFPIGPCAMELLKLRRESQLEGTLWVFPARSVNSEKGHYSDPSVAMNTVKERAGIKVLRGHDLRRTFGAACEKLGFTDRQTKRMLGHGVAAGETLGRYTSPEWADIANRMAKIEELILATAPDVYNALRPRNRARIEGGTEAKIDPARAMRAARRLPR
ncbi:tyrosine-type recombinase/integrase [Ramlibacter sp.]|uniref:tyrosine-type recombinase/integrase n=1 Tax=Ramlibacter sp. TaxID=1917967 RepID=UPI003D149694